MATITIKVQSLLNTAVYNSYTLSDSSTVAQLTSTIQTSTGVDPTWYALYFNATILASANTLASYGIVNGSTLRSVNKIARLSTREARQHAKLDLSKLDRQASGNPRYYYDITELPTQYSGNILIDNPNTGGLIEGRPWTTAPLDSGSGIITEAGDPIVEEDGSTQLQAE